MTNRKHPLDVGSVLYTSWGYDQTNVNFYKVVGLRGKTMVRIVPIEKKLVREDGSSTYVVAAPESVREFDVHLGTNNLAESKAGKWKRPRSNGTIRMSDCGTSAYLDDGREHYETHWLYGH